MIEKEILMEEVVVLLKARLNNLYLPNLSCRLMVDERCPPNAGEEFVGVYGGTTNNLNPPAHPTKQIEHSLRIGITRRLIGIANEHAGENILTENEIARVKPSIMARAREIINVMHLADGWTLLAAANTRIEEYGGCFLVPLGFVRADEEPSQKGPDHWDTEDHEEGGRGYVGLHYELEFGGALSLRTSSPS
jgi:hypothetical protein